jgi:XTP/dITP diphosphohydrolase
MTTDGRSWKEEERPMRVLRMVTSNDGKAREFAEALRGMPFRVERVHGAYEEVQADTLDEVALKSAQDLLAAGDVPRPFFLEDAGLFVDALRGFPGVYSAYVYRAVGWQGVLRLLHGATDRSARFESRIALVTTWGEVELFAGTGHGTIAIEAKGEGGFGFDPIFLARGETLTYAEMPLREKERVSHRGAALMGLKARLLARRPV